MLNQKICLVDYSEQSYGLKSLYTEALPRPQLDLLYLASALSVRPNHVSVLCEREDISESGTLRFEPLPQDPERFWREANYDLVVCLDSLAGASLIRPYLAQDVPLVLWSHLPPRHISMLPLQHAAVRDAWSAYVFESSVITKNYEEHYQLERARCNFRWPGMVRTLRKRFLTSEQLSAVRAPSLTMAFCADPASGLAQSLEIFQALKTEFSELKFNVFIKPGFEPELAAQTLKDLLQRCRETPDVEVLAAEPWPSQVEKLLSCHIICHPLAFQDLGCGELLDPLAVGCLAVLCEHEGLKEITGDQVFWVPPEPAEDYFGRYQRQVAEVLNALQNEPETMLERSFNQIARLNTHFTWDLRVWEWESLFYRIVGEKSVSS
jgi:hypothetical protein